MWLLLSSAFAAPESFDAVLAEALDRAPSSAAIEARRDAARAAARDAGALLEDPTAELERIGSDLEARVTVPVPLALQPIARAKLAAAGTEAADALRDAERAAFAAEIGRAYLELQRATERAALATDTLTVAVRSRDAARALRERGEIGAVDAAVAEALAARDAAEASLATQEVGARSLALEALVGRAPTGTLAPAGWPELEVPPAAGEPPALVAARSRTDALRADATLAVMDLLRPELVVGSAAGEPIVGVSMPVPVLSPGAAHLKAARAEVRAAEAETAALALATDAGLAAARLELEAATAAVRDTRVEGLREAFDALGAALAAGEYGLAEYVARREVLVAGLESGIEARFRLEHARLELWERLGRVPSEETP